MQYELTITYDKIGILGTKYYGTFNNKNQVMQTINKIFACYSINHPLIDFIQEPNKETETINNFETNFVKANHHEPCINAHVVALKGSLIKKNINPDYTKFLLENEKPLTKQQESDCDC